MKTIDEREMQKTTKEKSSQVNFFSNIRIYIFKKIQLSITEINIEIKTTATAVIKNELKYFLMSEGKQSQN